MAEQTHYTHKARVLRALPAYPHRLGQVNETELNHLWATGAAYDERNFRRTFTAVLDAVLDTKSLHKLMYFASRVQPVHGA